MGYNGKLIISLIAAIVFFVSAYIFFNQKIILGRLKDLYPDNKLSRNFVTLTFVFPVYFLFMILFLCFKKEAPNKEGSQFFTYRFVLPALALFVALQYLFLPVAYFTAVPSFYYISRVAKGYSHIANENNKLGHTSTVLEDYKKRFNSHLTSTEIILLSAKTAMVIGKANNRSTASERDENKVAKFNQAITLVNQMIEILKESESLNLGITTYSPLQWLHPSAPGEILLLTTMEVLLLERFNDVVIEKMDNILTNLEKKVGALPQNAQIDVKKELEKAKLNLSSTNSYKIGKS